MMFEKCLITMAFNLLHSLLLSTAAKPFTLLPVINFALLLLRYEIMPHRKKTSSTTFKTLVKKQLFKLWWYLKAFISFLIETTTHALLQEPFLIVVPYLIFQAVLRNSITVPRLIFGLTLVSLTSFIHYDIFGLNLLVLIPLVLLIFLQRQRLNHHTLVLPVVCVLYLVTSDLFLATFLKHTPPQLTSMIMKITATLLTSVLIS